MRLQAMLPGETAFHDASPYPALQSAQSVSMYVKTLLKTLHYCKDTKLPVI